MEIFGGIKTKVIHILVSADAVNIVVELYFGSVRAEELDIYLVPGIVLRCARRPVAGSGIKEERTCRTALLCRLH